MCGGGGGHLQQRGPVFLDPRKPEVGGRRRRDRGPAPKTNEIQTRAHPKINWVKYAKGVFGGGGGGGLRVRVWACHREMECIVARTRNLSSWNPEEENRVTTVQSRGGGCEGALRSAQLRRLYYLSPSPSHSLHFPFPFPSPPTPPPSPLPSLPLSLPLPPIVASRRRRRVRACLPPLVLALTSSLSLPPSSLCLPACLSVSLVLALTSSLSRLSVCLSLTAVSQGDSDGPNQPAVFIVCYIGAVNWS